jgi:triacylglycerol lipase
MLSSLVASAKDNARVVLVHGIFQQGRSFYFLKKELEKHGADCLVAQLKPADGRNGIESLAHQLKIKVEEKWDSNSKISVISHSMGGIVSRYYLQELGGHARCENFITMGTPHNGTITAYCCPGIGAKQMRPNSSFLQSLNISSHRLDKIKCVSYRTPLDLIILPSSSSIWNRAKNKKVWSLAHPLIMYHREVRKDLIRMINE